METRQLGGSGLTMSVVGLGCNNFGGMKQSLDTAAATAVVHAALDAGITLFDTADSYGIAGGSEILLGQALGARRRDIVLATKFASPMNREVSTRFNGGRRYIFQAVEDSLRRLNTDYIDLYQYHFPDPLTPIEETLGALDDLVRSGKVRHIACSNLPGWQLVDAAWTARHHGYQRFLSTQADYSLLARAAERELFAALRASHMTLLPYFPLASGLLTGKYRKGGAIPADGRMAIGRFAQQMTDARMDRVEALIAFAESRGRTILELAMSWLAAQPLVTSIIAGATTPAQVTANVAATAWQLSADDRAELDRLTLDAR